MTDQTEQFWGYHLTINAGDCSRAAVTDAVHIADFARALVKAIDMVAYGEPQIVHFGDDNKAGYTLIQLIETSNIAAHFCDSTGDIYLDVFSCRPYDIEVAKDLFCEYFKPARLNSNFFTRQA